MRIAIDAMGGDHAPGAAVRGVLEALAADQELSLVLVGDQDQIEAIAGEVDHDASRLRILHTLEAVGMDESPGMAMRKKPKSSINLCWKLLAEGEVEGIISAGNTGAVVAGGLMTRRFLKNVKRPGIAVKIPTPTGWTIMVDVGSNVAPKPMDLFQYGVMGMIYAKQVLNAESPTIGLLNIGTEEGKGTKLAKETSQLFQLSTMRESFKGNIEGRDVSRGLVDVIVCDGFVGNVVLKCCEGMVEFLLSAVAGELLSVLKEDREAAKHALHNLQNRFHYSEVGGAPLLGIDGVCLICHGSSDEKAFRNSVFAAKELSVVNHMIVPELESALRSVKVEMPS